MSDDLAADVARVLTALHDAGAWFRTGLTDHRLVELTGLSLAEILTARRSALADGLIERSRTGVEPAVTLLTTLGVARIRPPRPVESTKAQESGRR
ncbi:MAG: hypothetical protein ACRDGN_12170 [bacterium]